MSVVKILRKQQHFKFSVGLSENKPGYLNEVKI